MGLSAIRSDELRSSLPQVFSGRKILVIGDVMPDECLKGDVRRISPEAPVSVVEVKTHNYVPGGAGNVAASIASLGGQAVLSSKISNLCICQP